MIANTDGDGSKKQIANGMRLKDGFLSIQMNINGSPQFSQGGDSFSNYPFCKEVLDSGYSFVFTCKEDSRPGSPKESKTLFFWKLSGVNGTGGII
jgi:hypothetical protein